MGAAPVSDQQRVALGKVLSTIGGGQYLDQTTIGSIALPSRDTLGNNGAAGVLAFVNHLGAGVRLLMIVDQGYRIELANRVVAFQNNAGILPGDGGTGLHLGPRNLGVLAGDTAFGHEIVNASIAVLITGKPVLESGVLDLGVVQGHQLDHCGVELVGLPGRSGTPCSLYQ